MPLARAFVCGAGRHCEMGEPALVLTRNDVEREPAACPDRFDDIGPIASKPQARRADRREGPDVEATCLFSHVRDRPHGPLERLGRDHSGRLQTLAEARHAARSTTVRHRPCPPVSSSATWNLTELVPVSMIA